MSEFKTEFVIPRLFSIKHDHDPKDLDKLKLVHKILYEQGYCHVRVKGGDYAGSIAKFTPESYEIDYPDLKIHWSGNVKYHWSGRLSWKGKRNNPSYTLNVGSIFIGDPDVETVFEMINLKKIKEQLLKDVNIRDIDDKRLDIGDRVLYINQRYGSGGELCHGVVKEFKAHARDKRVSVVIVSDAGEESELNNPSFQIFKKED